MAKKVVKKKKIKISKKTVKKTVKKPTKTATKKAVKKVTAKKIPKSKCVKCGSNNFDIGEIKVGKVFHSHDFGYRSENHNPYADHVGQQYVKVCLSCGFAELYFNTDDLSRKTNK